MTSVFSWQNSVSLCPVSFCTPRSNLPVTQGISWLSIFAGKLLPSLEFELLLNKNCVHWNRPCGSLMVHTDVHHFFILDSICEYSTNAYLIMFRQSQILFYILVNFTFWWLYVPNINFISHKNQICIEIDLHSVTITAKSKENKVKAPMLRNIVSYLR